MCKHDLLTRDGVCFACKKKLFDYRPLFNTDTKTHVGYLKTELVDEVLG